MNSTGVTVEAVGFADDMVRYFGTLPGGPATEAEADCASAVWAGELQGREGARITFRQGASRWTHTFTGGCWVWQSTGCPKMPIVVRNGAWVAL
jgi:hypothetical protein